MADTNISMGGGWIALALLIIYFWGEPDLHDLVVILFEQLEQRGTL